MSQEIHNIILTYYHKLIHKKLAIRNGLTLISYFVHFTAEFLSDFAS